MSNNPQKSSPISRPDGVTRAERYLKKLCEHAFLTLWSHAGIYRDQGKTTEDAHGKEICDLLVVFDNHVIIFSDKDCHFSNSGDLDVDWTRWLRKAVFESAKQIWGAERWIKQFPNRLFLDRACKQPFPFVLPDPSVAQFHRIVVAHEAAKRCREKLGGSGSLMIDSGLEGQQHFAKSEVGSRPFTIGHVDRSKGFVHIFDDTSLEIVLKTLDTITDFVRYLTKKEQLLTSRTKILATGEEELLAMYLSRLNVNGERDFDVSKKYHVIAYEEGFWEDFTQSDARRSQIEADKISYFWDELIERFSRNILNNTLNTTSDEDVTSQEQLLRWLARESRFRRRMLAEALLDMAHKTPENYRAVRVVAPQKAAEPHYAFLLLPKPQEIPAPKYREIRQGHLMEYCLVTKLQFPEAQHIIGIASEAGPGRQESEDLVYFDARDWSDEYKKEAEVLQQEYGLLKKVSRIHKKYYEYPSVGYAQGAKFKGRDRNHGCYCGSGKKYKNCCGRSRSDASS